MLQPAAVNQIKALARRARLASVSGQSLELKLSPEESAALAEVLDEALAEDQSWFWSEAGKLASGQPKLTGLKVAIGILTQWRICYATWDGSHDGKVEREANSYFLEKR